MIVLGLLAMLAPAASMAASGSAGDNQYVDPLAGVHAKGGSHPSSSGGSAGAATSTTPAVTTPTATVAAATPTPTSAASSPSAKTLPFTGVEDWEIAGLGVVMLVSGLGLRRGTRA
jgi:hypothetical protein